jgi:hypothetical protein
MEETSSASPIFVPRINFATADRELASDPVDWGDCANVSGHLLIALKASGEYLGFRAALVLVNANWQIVAALHVPIVLEKGHPDDQAGRINCANIRILKHGPDSFEACFASNNLGFENMFLIQPGPATREPLWDHGIPAGFV